MGGDAPFPTASAASEQAPTPPRKELTPNRNARPSSSASQSSFGRGGPNSPEHTSENGLPVRQKGPPPVQAPAGGSMPRQTQPSMSIEQAAKPSFEITVGDPHKVGDITSSHIVYQVQTRVRPRNRCNPYSFLTMNIDNLEGISTARLRCFATIPRLFMALQFTSQ